MMGQGRERNGSKAQAVRGIYDQGGAGQDYEHQCQIFRAMKTNVEQTHQENCIA